MSEPQSTEKLSSTRIALIVFIIAASLALGIGSAVSPAIASVAEPIVMLLVVTGFSAYAVANVMRMVIHFRERRYGWSAFYLLAALILASLVISTLQSVFSG